MFPLGTDHGEVNDHLPESSHTRLAFDLAVGWRLSRNLSLEAATGLIRVRDGELWAEGATYASYYATTYDFRAVPLTVGLRAGIESAGGGMQLWVSGGAGAYWASATGTTHPYESVSLPDVDHSGKRVTFGGYVSGGVGFGILPESSLGLEVRFVAVREPFDWLDYSGGGVQLLLGLTHRFGSTGPAAAGGQGGADTPPQGQ